MRRAALLVAVFAAAGLLVAGAALAATIHVGSMRPLVVRGSGFKAREMVRVSLVRPTGIRIRRVRATAGGKLVVRFRLPLQDCPAWKILARGARGSRAALRSDPRIDCAPPAAP